MLLTAPFQILISSQRDAAGYHCGADLVWDRHRIHQNAAGVPVAFLPIVARNETYHPLLGEKIVKSLSTVAVHLCTRSFPPPAKFARRPPILFPVSTQGAPSELFVVVSDKWIKGP